MNLHDIYLAAQLAGKNSGGSDDLSDYYTKSQIDNLISEKVAEIVADAPEDFNTLKETSDWIANHEDSAAAMNSAIADNTTAIANKVDKIAGKGLSTNDFTDADKSKLDGLSNYDDTEIKTDIAEVASQAAINGYTLGYQRKNLLMNNCKNITKNGVTAAVNADGSISFGGSNTFGSSFMIYANLQTGAATGQYVDNKKFLPNGKYILSGSKSGVNLQVRLAEIENSEGELVSSSNGGETTFTVTDAHKYVWSRVLITPSADFGSEGITIYPMIRLAEITDDTYEPYKPSIDERLTALENAILGGNSND